MTTQETRHFDSESYAILRDQMAEVIEGRFDNQMNEAQRLAWKKIFSLLPAYDSTEKKFISLHMECKIQEFKNTIHQARA